MCAPTFVAAFLPTPDYGTLIQQRRSGFQNLFNYIIMERLKLLLLWYCGFIAFSASAQIKFTNQVNTLTPGIHRSGVAMAVTDMNGDGLDDIIRMDGGNNLNIQYQTLPNQPFLRFNQPDIPVAEYSQWGICTADFDNNGFGDVLTGGAYDGVKIIHASNDGSNYSLYEMLLPEIFMQGANFADINNDGLLDAFTCHDDGVSAIFGNNGDGTFSYQPMWIDLRTVPSSDNSGNYGSVWSDVNNDGHLDLYIAHCRQGVNDPNAPERINQLFLNNGDGTYTQDVTNASGLRIGAQSWTADFGDIDNDGDFDCFITNHDVSSQILENDGAGHFTDISVSAGIYNQIFGLPIQGVFRDFDNDGFVDILVAGQFVQSLYRNNGNKTFTRESGLFDNQIMESFALGDLNNDGFQDIYAGYAELYTSPSTIPDAIWINNGNNNHFFGLHLQGEQSNRDAVGAKVQLHSALGIQTREVRSGESYGISNSLNIHFGLGQVPVIDSVVIFWPAGGRDVLYQPERDQYLSFTEGGCSLASFYATPGSDTRFCVGDSVTLTAPNDFLYQWNSGETTQMVTVKTSGEYRVTITSPQGCTGISNTINVVVNPVEIPEIKVVGDPVFCEGYSMPLTATATTINGYVWSTGDTTATLEVTAGGVYTVTTRGLCESFTSLPITIEMVENDAPIVTPVTIPAGSTASLQATGTDVTWYDSETGGNTIATGNIFETPTLNSSTTYWATNTTVFPLPTLVLGSLEHEGSQNGSANFIGKLIFDVYEPIYLARVKVFSLVAAERTILIENVDGVTTHSKTVFIPLGESYVELGFDIEPGLAYEIYTDAALNLQNVGTLNPQLKRSDSGVSYPYELENKVAITGSNAGNDRYYYFYEWHIGNANLVCESPRVPVTATIETISGVQQPAWAHQLQLFPNPTSGQIQLSGTGLTGNTAFIAIKSTAGATVFSKETPLAQGNMQQDLQLGALPKGIYWLEIKADDEVVHRRIAVQ
jgi:hypothetical protein